MFQIYQTVTVIFIDQKFSPCSNLKTLCTTVNYQSLFQKHEKQSFRLFSPRESHTPTICARAYCTPESPSGNNAGIIAIIIRATLMARVLGVHTGPIPELRHEAARNRFTCVGAFFLPSHCVYTYNIYLHAFVLTREPAFKIESARRSHCTHICTSVDMDTNKFRAQCHLLRHAPGIYWFCTCVNIYGVATGS